MRLPRPWRQFLTVAKKCPKGGPTWRSILHAIQSEIMRLSVEGGQPKISFNEKGRGLLPHRPAVYWVAALGYIYKELEDKCRE